MRERKGAGPKLTEIELSMRGSETGGEIADNYQITRELMDSIIDLIDGERFESALSLCEDIGLVPNAGKPAISTVNVYPSNCLKRR